MVYCTLVLQTSQYEQDFYYVIEHFDQPKVFIDKIKKALKSKGLMVIVTIDSNTPLYVVAKLMRLFGFSLAYKRLYDPHHLNHFSKKNLLRLAKNTDLEVCFSSGINVPLKSLDIPLLAHYLRDSVPLVLVAKEGY